MCIICERFCITKQNNPCSRRGSCNVEVMIKYKSVIEVFNCFIIEKAVKKLFFLIKEFYE